VATAFAATFGGVATWLLYRRDKRRDLPSVELTIDRDRDNGLVARVIVRNHIDEILIVDRLSVVKPKGTTISLGINVAGGVRRPPSRPDTTRIKQ
jgi:hypothetical protein